MKKISSILLALTMLLALCVPAFAGEAVNAMTQEGGKQIAVAIVRYVKAASADDAEQAQAIFADAQQRATMYKEAVLPAITLEKFGDKAYRETSVSEAVKALKADYALTDEVANALSSELTKFISDNYVGVDGFDKDEIKDNIASDFSENDLNALFSSLKNSVSTLSDRVTGVLRGFGGGSNAGGDGSNGEQPDAGMQDPTGDTAMFAVLGVAAVAGAALIVTRKKSAK